jgi:ribosome-associated translation inhibitor RaiA
MMRIEVLGDDSIGGQARTYAEYRLFSTLSQVVDIDRVRDARVMLLRAVAGEGVSCAIHVDLDGGEGLRARASGGHPYAAINDAVDRLRRYRCPPLVSG